MTTEEIKKRIGAQLRTLREEKDWSQEHLANLVDSTGPYISSIENANANWCIDTIGKICEALDAELVGFEIRKKTLVKDVERNGRE